MKRFAALLAALVLLGALGCTPNAPAAPSAAATAEPAQKPAEQAAEPAPEQPIEPPAEPEGEILSDFSVETVDGGVFTLSEALKEHELVLINLFASWCPPCRREFPAMQEAADALSDRVAVIALSCEPDDTLDLLRDYAAELGLHIPMGLSAGTDLDRFVTIGYPTSLLVDRSGRVAAEEVGAKLEAAEFLDWFDRYTGENYNPSVCTYTVYVYGEINGEDVIGAVLNFCSDTACTPVTTAELGCAEFSGAPGRYHVQVVKMPAGWKLAYDADADFYTEPYDQTFWIAALFDGNE